MRLVLPLALAALLVTSCHARDSRPQKAPPPGSAASAAPVEVAGTADAGDPAGGEPAAAATVVPAPASGTAPAASSGAAPLKVGKPPEPAVQHAMEPPPRRAYGFRPGESLIFDVKWFFITAGQAAMRVTADETVGGERCMHFIATAKSTLVFFFKVNDVIESWSTVDGILPVKYEKHLHEGGYRKDQVATFDRAKLTATWGSGAPVPIRTDCHDLLGSFFKLRAMSFPEPGGETSMCTHTNKMDYDVIIKILRRETIKVPAGEFRTIGVKPRLKFEGLFRQKGDIEIWLTDDAAHMPVLVKSRVFLLGSVDVVLVKKETP